MGPLAQPTFWQNCRKDLSVAVGAGQSNDGPLWVQAVIRNVRPALDAVNAERISWQEDRRLREEQERQYRDAEEQDRARARERAEAERRADEEARAVS
jgi:hypothetical protein